MQLAAGGTQHAAVPQVPSVAPPSRKKAVAGGGQLFAHTPGRSSPKHGTTTGVVAWLVMELVAPLSVFVVLVVAVALVVVATLLEAVVGVGIGVGNGVGRGVGTGVGLGVTSGVQRGSSASRHWQTAGHGAAKQFCAGSNA